MKAATLTYAKIVGLSWISIHAAREGGDTVASSKCSQSLQFQSTPPVKAATSAVALYKRSCRISIHAAREGGDVQKVEIVRHLSVISIHAAREGGDRIPCR